MSKLRTCLWFEKGGFEAARFYCALIPGSVLESETEGFMVLFTLAGAPYQIMNAGDRYRPTPAASICVYTDDQAETDRIWAGLTEGGEEGMCGWCVDAWGVSWQVVPRALPNLLGGQDLEAAGRATRAMRMMKKIDIAALETAYHGN